MMLQPAASSAGPWYLVQTSAQQQHQQYRQSVCHSLPALAPVACASSPACASVPRDWRGFGTQPESAATALPCKTEAVSIPVRNKGFNAPEFYHSGFGESAPGGPGSSLHAGSLGALHGDSPEQSTSLRERRSRRAASSVPAITKLLKSNNPGANLCTNPMHLHQNLGT